jgi:hypothetical protein
MEIWRALVGVVPRRVLPPPRSNADRSASRSIRACTRYVAARTTGFATMINSAGPAILGCALKTLAEGLDRPLRLEV